MPELDLHLISTTLTKVRDIYYAWVTMLGDPEKAKRFTAKMSIGEKGKSGAFHCGRVFPVDMKVCSSVHYCSINLLFR